MAVIDILNLRKALDNLVGSSLIKGISGGEKRRLSLGMEMM
jgi:ABC-type multidrug transport system ATPase subunit